MTDAKSQHRVPLQAHSVAMWLFLAALTMLFGATMLAYFVVRARQGAAPAFQLPRTLWISTALMLAGSVTIHFAVAAARRERQQELRRHLVMTCVFAALFVIVQTPAMLGLLDQHRAMSQQRVFLYGLIFVLILVHALHVLGGLVGLGITTANAFRGRYDHESYVGVQNAARYWHFLDVVWIVMYLGIFFTG